MGWRWKLETYLIPPRSIRPDLNQLLVELKGLFVDTIAIELRGVDCDV